MGHETDADRVAQPDQDTPAAGEESEASVAGPEVAEPEVAGPEVVEPEVVEPEVADGAAVEPEVVAAGSEDAGPSLVEPEDAEVLALRDEVASLQARLRAVSNAYREVQEEIQATKDRLHRQATAREERRRGEVVSALFDPLQNLRRSIDATRKGASTEDTVSGLEIVVGQFMDAFKKLGLEEVPGKGTPFDPNLHEALTTMPVTDPALDDVVIDVFDAGYRIGNTLIQPARVIVGRYQAPETAEA